MRARLLSSSWRILKQFCQLSNSGLKSLLHASLSLNSNFFLHELAPKAWSKPLMLVNQRVSLSTHGL